MKYYNLIFIILIIFAQTGNVLSKTKTFDVNNVEIEKKDKISNEASANQAIKKGFSELINKILLSEDIVKLKQLKFSEIKELVNYYQVSNQINEVNTNKTKYNISFDKNKIHNLFYKKGISYSEIINKELFILPILKKNNQIYIYNQNFIYSNWNTVHNTDTIEFILPSENIEVIQNVNTNTNNLLNLKFNDLFQEYKDKNLALVIIEEKNSKEEKIYFKTRILGKNIVSNINLKRLNLNKKEFYEKIIKEIKLKIINLVKLQNLIDISTPSFLNVQFKMNNSNNLVELNLRLKQINLIENVYVQEFNNKSVLIKIKYHGKLDTIITQLKDEKIILELLDSEWNLEII